jgi:hypothetical protein
MMDWERLNRWRDLISKIAAVFCMIALLALVDGLLRHFREPSNLIKVLPGTSVEINGELTDEAQRLGDLTFASNSDQLKVTFEAIHSGYFLGGDMWRGRLMVGPGISPGEYSLSVIPKHAASPRKAPAFRIRVFRDALSLQKSSTSLVRRWLGISPFGVAAVCLPLILLAFGAVYVLSGKRETLLAAAGKAEVYRVIRTESGCEIRFALGVAQGIVPGTQVIIYNEAGRQVGIGNVEASNQTDAAAQVTTSQEIKVGYLVMRA